MSHHDEDHDRGLAYDLSIIHEKIMERRRALAFLGSIGTAALVTACGGSGSSGSSSASSSTGGSSSSGDSSSTGGSSSTGDSSSSSGDSSSSGSCSVTPSETNGPYPADGTNRASGATSNVLTSSGIVRSDIRPSFISSTTVATGVLLTLTLKLVNVNNGCTPIAGAAIYIWQCDVLGRYSLYSSGVITESYLRGVQFTDANGEVTFTTIYPACYSGRWPHIHFEIYLGLTATSSNSLPAGTEANPNDGDDDCALISQLALPDAINQLVFADSRYSTSVANYRQISLSSDNVFGDNTSAQIAQMTPELSGSVSAGYTGTATIAIAA